MTNRIISILLFYKRSEHEAILLSQAYNLSDLYFWARPSAKELLLFTSREIAKRTKKHENQYIKEKDCLCFCYVDERNIGYVVISTIGVKLNIVAPKVVADVRHGVIIPDEKLSSLDNVDAVKNLNTWDGQLENIAKRWDDVDKKIEEGQDKMLKIRKELEETKDILYKTVDDILERGEKLEILIDKTNDLSVHSKIFAKKSRDLNRCCIIL
ncbi:Synaptobrevin/VAMP-like protein [Orpheovirus IHUMI-LCC2]|uniref:Synaptobrevin/VAMP-like protein n=1 Tax=Orpheovirus IHUMI-LCC2 TaxID=2023057 RepID=A0A2I2L530_9VIRU|nr:Synaptobrevin/VAMP-like protein [Orpheovirus IHUMI-LCC2]SNW62648.1 Synaptobrevin/VAMP-like protein [Orpheovirus IHUMI-LCC2]